MRTDTVVRARIDPDIKARATEALEALGLSVSDAIRLLLIHVAEEKRLPFTDRVPNAVTTKAINELESGGENASTHQTICSKTWVLTERAHPVRSTQFKRDVKRAKKRGKDLSKLRTLLSLLIERRPLPASSFDHPLKGNWKGYGMFISNRTGCSFTEWLATNCILSVPAAMPTCFRREIISALKVG